MSKLLERVKAEGRFFSNTIKEAVLHPLSTSLIDKKTGQVVSRNGHKMTVNKPDSKHTT